MLQYDQLHAITEISKYTVSSIVNTVSKDIRYKKTIENSKNLCYQKWSLTRVSWGGGDFHIKETGMLIFSLWGVTC